ncbi:alpha/beta hydrolase [uncultured Brevundimonas sp.]|uniref:alpha/beta fold hydrolase n=1 Tax=uncultured Brevundimonas sp. TaxID=213418 RepID=UPI0025EBC0E7|nr:alpha/beta hydrolase [uncultured Brevundimonas sp.]
MSHNFPAIDSSLTCVSSAICVATGEGVPPICSKVKFIQSRVKIDIERLSIKHCSDVAGRAPLDGDTGDDRMPFVTNGGVRLHWQERGQGTPILLIMGHRYSSAMWYPISEAFSDRYRLISFDNQGTGESGARKRTSVAEMVSDALAVLDAAGVDSAHVYGVSMGGGLALEFGIRYPNRVRSLILGCTMAKTPDIKRGPKWLLTLIYRLSPLLKGLASKTAKKAYGDAAPDDRIARDMAMLANDAFDMDGVIAQGHAISDYSVEADTVRSVTKPTLVLHGVQDHVVPYEAGRRLSELLPNARLVTLEGVGHNYFVGAGERANAEVERFIAEVEGGPMPYAANTAGEMPRPKQLLSRD